MIEPLLRRLIEHKRRKSIVIILTILTGLLIVLPAADEYNAAKERLVGAKLELEDTREEVASLGHFERLFEEKLARLKRLEGQAISDKDAQRLRSDLVATVRQTGCTIRQIRLGEVVRRDWTTTDGPVRGTVSDQRGEETPYRLETRQMSLSIAGAMANLHQFLSRVHKIDKLIHTKEVSLKRSDEGKNTAILDMDVVLFDLVRKPEE